jgi:hypothetical protein
MSVREYCYAVAIALATVGGFLLFLEVLKWLVVR